MKSRGIGYRKESKKVRLPREGNGQGSVPFGFETAWDAIWEDPAQSLSTRKDPLD